MASSGSYRVSPCFHGVKLTSNDNQLLDGEEQKSSSSEPIYLPGGNQDEEELISDAEMDWYPATVCLESDDLNILCEQSNDEKIGNFAFTTYGSKDQDKESNQDFTLCGTFPEHNASFCVIADGISNGFAFPQRGAHLTCFASYFAIKEFLKSISSKSVLEESDVDNLRSELVSKINSYFKSDYEHLHNINITPAHINKKIWQDKFKNKIEKWYGNTLLLSVLTDIGGLCIYAGDGAILLVEIHSNEKSEVVKIVNESDESSALSNFITSELSQLTFKRALISKKECFTKVLMCTDGIERTAKQNISTVMEFIPWDSPKSELRKWLENIENEYDPDTIDLDNYSLAYICQVPVNCTVSKPDLASSVDTALSSDQLICDSQAEKNSELNKEND